MSHKIETAEDLFERFSGHELDQAFNVEMPAPDGEVIFAFGILSAFESDDGSWMEFDPEDSPMICASYDGGALYVYSEDYKSDIGNGQNDGVILRAVEYATYRNGEFDLYRHEFDADDPPMLKSDSEGRLIIDGGICFFEDHGIID